MLLCRFRRVFPPVKWNHLVNQIVSLVLNRKTRKLLVRPLQISKTINPSIPHIFSNLWTSWTKNHPMVTNPQLRAYLQVPSTVEKATILIIRWMMNTVAMMMRWKRSKREHLCLPSVNRRYAFIFKRANACMAISALTRMRRNKHHRLLHASSF